MLNEYRGFTLTPGARIARVDSSLPPEAFFERFIRARRPVVVTGALDDAEWRGAAALARAPTAAMCAANIPSTRKCNRRGVSAGVSINPLEVALRGARASVEFEIQTHPALISSLTPASKRHCARRAYARGALAAAALVLV